MRTPPTARLLSAFVDVGREQLGYNPTEMADMDWLGQEQVSASLQAVPLHRAIRNGRDRQNGVFSVVALVTG